LPPTEAGPGARATKDEGRGRETFLHIDGEKRAGWAFTPGKARSNCVVGKGGEKELS